MKEERNVHQQREGNHMSTSSILIPPKIRLLVKVEASKANRCEIPTRFCRQSGVMAGKVTLLVWKFILLPQARN